MAFLVWSQVISPPMGSVLPHISRALSILTLKWWNMEQGLLSKIAALNDWVLRMRVGAMVLELSSWRRKRHVQQIWHPSLLFLSSHENNYFNNGKSEESSSTEDKKTIEDYFLHHSDNRDLQQPLNATSNLQMLQEWIITGVISPTDANIDKMHFNFVIYFLWEKVTELLAIRNSQMTRKASISLRKFCSFTIEMTRKVPAVSRYHFAKVRLVLSSLIVILTKNEIKLPFSHPRGCLSTDNSVWKFYMHSWNWRKWAEPQCCSWSWSRLSERQHPDWTP